MVKDQEDAGTENKAGDLPSSDTDYPPLDREAMMGVLDLANLTSDDFQPFLKRTFQVFPEGFDPLSWTLVDVRELRSSPVKEEGSARPAFSIVFQGPVEPVIPQGIYKIQHEEMGSLELFLVPIGPSTDGGMQYEAIFA